MDRFILIFLTLAALAMGGKRSQAAVSPVECTRENYLLVQTTGSTTGVAINEIMADPTPLVGLPDAEWIELVNYGQTPVSLKGWSIRVGSLIRILPDSILSPGFPRIVCAVADAPELVKFGKIVAIQSFPALRNSGNRITLSDNSGAEADVTDYSDKWYDDNRKKQGGWSLERIDPERKCGQQANWKASADPRGGTPGAANTVYAPNPDRLNPEISFISVLSPYTVEIRFSEIMDTLSLHQRDNYLLRGRESPDSIAVTDGKYVVLTWFTPLQTNTTYTLQILNLSDECGNPLLNPEAEISWVSPEPGDVVIHEILFNPWPGGNDFIEIANISSKNIDAAKLMIAGRDGAGQLKNPVSLESAFVTIRKGSLMAFTTDTMGVIPFYPALCRDNLREVASLPAMNNDRGCVVLLDDSLEILDEMEYDESMHHPLLAGSEGVSLERINPSLPGDNPANWHSASSSAGFATPGCPNSQHSVDPSLQSGVVFEQTAFSPDNDGYNDELLIRFLVQEPGLTANCMVYDTSGNARVRLLNNAMPGVSETIRWNGKDETGSLLPPGPYVVLLELFDMKGGAATYKKAVVLTRKWP